MIRGCRGAPAIALAVSIPLAVVYLIVQPPGGDLAAATYRSELFARVGLTLWDNGWYGGHYLPGYSLLAPALGALLGNRLLLALATVAAAGLFAAIAQRALSVEGARIAAGSFALGVSVTMLSGRIAFTLGLAVGLLAVVALPTDTGTPASAYESLRRWRSRCSRASRVRSRAPFSLSRDSLTRWRGARRAGSPAHACGSLPLAWSGLAIAAAALAPILLLALAFPEGGWEPFAPSVFWPGLAGVALIALMLPQVAGGKTMKDRAPGGRPAERAAAGLSPRAVSALTWGAWLYALALIGAFALHTPVGSNAARLGELLAAPLVAGVLWGRHRFTLLLLAPVLLYWQLETPINDVSELVGDPSVNASFYAPLLGELRERSGGAPLRVEIPMMGTHWESVYLPEQGSILLARGWERQLDTRYAGLFYEEGGRSLTPAAYRAWLYENAVSYVALPDVRLDFSGEAEGRLIARGLPYLREVWRSPHWRLFAVAGAPALAQPPALLSALGADSFTLRAPRPGSYAVRVRFTPYWALEQGRGCVQSAPGGWTVVDARAAGTIRVGIAFSLTRIFSQGPRCA